MPNNDDTLHVRVPSDWKPKLKKIAEADDRDTSSITRRALIKAHPELTQAKRDHEDAK